MKQIKKENNHQFDVIRGGDLINLDGYIYHVEDVDTDKQIIYFVNGTVVDYTEVSIDNYYVLDDDNNYIRKDFEEKEDD